MVHTNRSTIRADDCRPLSELVPIAVAEAAGVDPMDLRPPLYEAVDLEALETLFDSHGTASDLQVTFEYAGFTVVVDGPADIRVEPREIEVPSVATASGVEP